MGKLECFAFELRRWWRQVTYIPCAAWRILGAAARRQDILVAAQALGLTTSPRSAGPLIWFHAATLGDCKIAMPVIHRMVLEYNEKVCVLLTVACVDALPVLRASLPRRVTLQLAPGEHPQAAALFLRHWQPSVGVHVDLGVSPILAVAAREAGIPLALLDAHVPDDTFRRWHRSRMSRALYAAFIRSYALVVPQSDVDVGRFRMLGAHLEQMPGWCSDLNCASRLTASVWHMWRPYVRDVRAVRAATVGRTPWIASDVAGEEEEMVCQVHEHLQKECKGVLTFIVPRSMQQCPAIVERLASTRARVSLWSHTPHDFAATDVMVVDTHGQLPLLYAICEVAFIGSTLVERDRPGSIAQSAVAGCAVICGTKSLESVRLAEELNNAANVTAEESANAVFTAGVHTDDMSPMALAQSAPEGGGERADVVSAHSPGAAERLNVSFAVGGGRSPTSAPSVLQTGGVSRRSRSRSPLSDAQQLDPFGSAQIRRLTVPPTSPRFERLLAAEHTSSRLLTHEQMCPGVSNMASGEAGSAAMQLAPSESLDAVRTNPHLPLDTRFYDRGLGTELNQTSTSSSPTYTQLREAMSGSSNRERLGREGASENAFQVLDRGDSAGSSPRRSLAVDSRLRATSVPISPTPSPLSRLLGSTSSRVQQQQRQPSARGSSAWNTPRSVRGSVFSDRNLFNDEQPSSASMFQQESEMMTARVDRSHLSSDSAPLGVVHSHTSVAQQVLPPHQMMRLGSQDSSEHCLPPLSPRFVSLARRGQSTPESPAPPGAYAQRVTVLSRRSEESLTAAGDAHVQQHHHQMMWLRPCSEQNSLPTVVEPLHLDSVCNRSGSEVSMFGLPCLPRLSSSEALYGMDVGDAARAPLAGPDAPPDAPDGPASPVKAPSGLRQILTNTASMPTSSLALRRHQESRASETSVQSAFAVLPTAHPPASLPLRGWETQSSREELTVTFPRHGVLNVAPSTASREGASARASDCWAGTSPYAGNSHQDTASAGTLFSDDQHDGRSVLLSPSALDPGHSGAGGATSAALVMTLPQQLLLRPVSDLPSKAQLDATDDDQYVDISFTALRHTGEYILSATNLPFHPHGPAVWLVSSQRLLLEAVTTLLREPIERRSRGHAAAQGASRLATNLVSTVWDVVDGGAIEPALLAYEATTRGRSSAP